MYLKSFEDLTIKDVMIAGGKGASLGEMVKAGLPIPPGFVIFASAFDRFLEETDLNAEIETRLKKVDLKDVNSVERVSIEISDLMRDSEFPSDLKKKILASFKNLGAARVAVRSSATAEDSQVASWAGELESYLNTSQEDLIENVRKCWISLFTPRAIFYRLEKDLVKVKVSVAVVVQAMIQSEVSGICFTVHPVTEDYDQMVVEAGFGLGEAIVGGQITPDTYIIEKNKLLNTGCILDKNISEQKMMIVRGKEGNVDKKISITKRFQQKLSDEQITELSKLCLQIEKHYKNPQDIEWAFADNKFYITQSRPITTLK